MILRFYKYHGTGNDFILLEEKPQNPEHIAKKMCDRHFGIGADGLIFPEASNVADIKFHYYNADGTIAPMCGNGMRCFVKFMTDLKRIEKKSMTVESIAGLIQVSMDEDHQMIKIDLGQPIFELSQNDVATKQSGFASKAFEVDGHQIMTYTIFLGTLHTIVYMDEQMNIYDVGPKLSSHPYFTKHTNVNFVKVIDRTHQHVQTFERGAGWTLSCGTGTAASAVVSNQLGYVDDVIHTKVPGGDLNVYINKTITLEGPAVRIASGIYEG